MGFLNLSCYQGPSDNRGLWKVAPLRTAAPYNSMEGEKRRFCLDLALVLFAFPLPSDCSVPRFSAAPFSPAFGCLKVLNSMTGAKSPHFVKNPPKEGDHFPNHSYGIPKSGDMVLKYLKLKVFDFEIHRIILTNKNLTMIFCVQKRRLVIS